MEIMTHFLFEQVNADGVADELIQLDIRSYN